jgi:mannitol/fructose-specific phosphotransferase system IIA component (Ntr-type)
MKLSDIFVPEAIVPRLAAETRDEAIRELVAALADAGATPNGLGDAIIKAVLAREAQTTTGMGKGVAVPHAKVKGIVKPTAAIGCSEPGVDFAALDGLPVHAVILLLSNPEDPDGHLQAMETMFRHIQRHAFRTALQESRTRDEIADLIQHADEIG